MSALADRVLTQRQHMAAPGSSHDRLIRIARVALPVSVGVLVLLLALAPLAVSSDISFLLAKDRVEVARERMRVSQAVYRGQDGKGQPFRLTAASAVQQSSRDPIVRMFDLGARVDMAEGPATIVAPRGRYDMNSERIAVDGPVSFRDAAGYRVQTRDVAIDLKTRRFASAHPVTGETPLGRFSGDRLTGDLSARTVQLDGRARLHIAQGGGRAGR